MVEEGSDVSLNTAAHGGLGHHAAACVPSFILLGTCTSKFQHSPKIPGVRQACAGFISACCASLFPSLPIML